MRRKKCFCLLLSAVLLLAGCGGKSSTANNRENMPEGGRHDYELTEETADLLLEEGETILWGQYLEGERVWFLENDADRLLCYHEDKGERKPLLEHVPAAFTGCSLYTDGKNFFAYQTDRLAVLDAAGKERHSLRLEGWISDLCMSKEGSIVLAVESGSYYVLKTFDVESGAVSGSSIRLSSLAGLGTGVERGILVIDRMGAYDLDMESGEKIWHMKWNGTSYTPTYEKFLIAARIGEDGALEQIKRDDDKNYYLSYLQETYPEEAGKIPLVFRVLAADVGLKKIVAKFNRENGEYHVFLEDKGEEYGWDLQSRTDMEIATGKGPDLIAADTVTDMRVLAEKGGLENLEPYLEQAAMGREGYHQETFQSQGMESGIYSAGYAIRVGSLYLREEFLGSGGQTDIKTLLDNLEGYEGQAIFSRTLGYTPVNLMCYFFRMSDDFYGMVDWEGKTCDFSGELWERILRVCGRYGLTEWNGEWEEIAELGYIYDFSSMVGQERRAEEQGMVLAGYPSEEGMVNWIQMDSVAINAGSAHKEGAWQFICFLLEEENQTFITQGAAMPVHQGALEKCVEDYLYDYYNNDIYTSDGRRVTKYPLPEGIEERFWEGIANARPASYRTEQVIAIIAEEAEFYFMGDKSLEEVSAVIENRVRLYLAEQE